MVEMDEKISTFTLEEDNIEMTVGDRTARVGSVNIEGSDYPSRFLKNLIDKKEEVEETLSHLMQAFREQKNTDTSRDLKDEVDNAELEISAHVHYSLIQRKNKELEKIERLIRRALQEEEFGFCEECGERIPDERLLIVPGATHCVPCQRDLEKLDSRKSSAQRSQEFPGRKSGFQWEEESDDQGAVIPKPDMDYISIVDFEETDLGNKL